MDTKYAIDILPIALAILDNLSTTSNPLRSSSMAARAISHSSVSLAPSHEHPSKEKISWKNLIIGAGMNIFQVTSLGQPMENIKTYVSANRNATLGQAFRALSERGFVRGFYQGLIPWAWLEASTKGSILILTSSEVNHHATNTLGLSPAVGATLGGVAGGAAQSYLTMGMTTCMKTVEVTRTKNTSLGGKVPGTMETFVHILRTQGVRGVNKGVNAVALRQITGWASRMGISKAAEHPVRKLSGKPSTEKLSMTEKITASTIGGALSCWNQPFEVIRVDMQAVKANQALPKPTMVSTAKLIWHENGLKGFFRGVIPRIGVASWATICMVGLGDAVREMFAEHTAK